MCCFRIGTYWKLKHFKPRPQNRILVLFRGSFQNFQWAPLAFLYWSPAPLEFFYDLKWNQSYKAKKNDTTKCPTMWFKNSPSFSTFLTSFLRSLYGLSECTPWRNKVDFSIKSFCIYHTQLCFLQNLHYFSFWSRMCCTWFKFVTGWDLNLKPIENYSLLFKRTYICTVGAYHLSVEIGWDDH